MTLLRRTITLLLPVLLTFPGLRVRAADDVTIIQLRDRVLVRDCRRLGINLGGDTYYSGAALVKARTSQNFEGTSYRQCHFGPLQDEQGAATWFRVSDEWKKVLTGGRFTILSGPNRGASGTITDITTRKIRHKGQLRDFPYFQFDRPLPAGPANSGILVERLLLHEGQCRPHHQFWNSAGNYFITDDVDPDSFGSCALVLAGSEQPAHMRFSTQYQRYGDTNGTWRIQFRAKVIKGSPQLMITADRSEWGDRSPVAVKPKWTQHELTLNVDAVPEPMGPDDNPHLFFRFRASNGEVAIDDVVIERHGDTNPTVFRDDCVEVLQDYRPGVLRFLQMGGNTLDNCLQPPLQAHSFASSPGSKPGPFQQHNKNAYSLHEMYELCEYIDCDPWYCLPGTLHPEEILNFIEYLAAPADTGYGQVRARLGHPQPWTEVFDTIHVEFGNEAWNNAGPYQVGGFNGPDYWAGLIEAAKDSPHFEPEIVFHAGGQAAHTYRNRGILKNVPNADYLSVAPYVLQSFSQADSALLNTDDKLFRWAFTWPLQRASREQGAMKVNHELAQQAGTELSVYEMNHHITRGDGPLDPRNTIVTSIGGGINIANTMLHQLKDFGARTQCLFSLIQHGYNAHGIGQVRLWGSALNMRDGQRRYRPTFLACALANRVITGDLVETRHLGADPVFSATGVFTRDTGVETIDNLPCLHSFAFNDGDRHGLLIISLDTSRSRRVQLKFNGTADPTSVQIQLLHGDSITASNEFEQPQPQVEITDVSATGFQSGWQYDLPPACMLGITWNDRP